LKKHLGLNLLSLAGLAIAVFLAFGSVDGGGSSGSTTGSGNIGDTTPSTPPRDYSSAPSKPDLEVLDYSSKSEEYARYVVGTVRNNSDRNYSYVQVEVNLLDKSGNVVGSTLANVNNLGPGKKWKFKAIILEDEARSFEIKDVTGW